MNAYHKINLSQERLFEQTDIKKKERNYVEFPILVCLHGYSGKKEKKWRGQYKSAFPP